MKKEDANIAVQKKKSSVWKKPASHKEQRNGKEHHFEKSFLSAGTDKECDNVTDDTRCNAVFAEHGASTFQMTTAKVLDTISRPPRLAGKANDAVSAYTQVKMKDTGLLKASATEFPTIWIRVSRHRRAAHWVNITHRAVPLQTKLFGHPLEDLVREDIWKTYSCKKNGKESKVGNACISVEKTNCSCQKMLTTSRWWVAGQTEIQGGQNYERRWTLRFQHQ